MDLQELVLYLLEENNTLLDPLEKTPYVSEDGSMGIVFQRPRLTTDEDHNLLEMVLRVRVLDKPSEDRNIVFLDGPPCDLGNISDCPRPRAKEQTKEINKFLAKHRWKEFAHYQPWIPGVTVSDCEQLSFARHFRVPGYEVTYRQPHFRMVRQKDQAIVADRYDMQSSLGNCSSQPRSYVESVGLDPKRRAGVVVLQGCRLNCFVHTSYFFFRLPKEAP